MKYVFFSLLCSAAVLMTSPIVSCGCRESASVIVRTVEEIRLEKINRIDTASISEVLRPDTIAGWVELSRLSAEAWMLVEDSSGLLISAKNVDKRMYPASLTKMMTCLLALEQGNMGDTIVIKREDYVTRDAWVKPGDRYEMGNLVTEMMLLSDNVAAVALANHLGSDTLSFLEMMNKKAAYLGLDSTRFANPNGMPCDSNYTTARDLMALTRYCLCDTAFAHIVATPFADVPLADDRHFPCQNRNQLLADYAGCIGVKTGYAA